MGQALQPDVVADTVRIDPPTFAHPAPPWWVYLLLLALPLGVPWLMTEALRHDWPAWPMWIVYGVYTIGVEVSAAYHRWLVGRLTPKTSDGTLAGLALQCWRSAAMKRRSPGMFDAAMWIEPIGPQGPRLIAVGCKPRAFETPADLAEPVDMGAGRRVSGRERQWLVWMLGMSVCQVAISGFVLRGPVSQYWSILVVVFWLGYGVWSLSRLGVRPFSLTAAVATPGRLETSWFGRDAVFTRADSVLVLTGSKQGARATLVRNDGRTFKIHFMHPDAGQPHPALVDLLARWCCRGAS